MKPVELDIDLVQGDVYSMTITFTDANGAAINYSTATFAAQIRPTFTSPDAQMTAFTVDATNKATGIVIISLTSAQTRKLPTQCRWDFEIRFSGVPTTLFAGAVNAIRDVTR